jgi:hypothetical protein
MRTKAEIRAALLDELKHAARLESMTHRWIEREIDRRFHWERIIEEAEAYERAYGAVKIEFIAAPDDEACKLCWQMNGKTMSLDELKSRKNLFGCRCAIVLPREDTE